MYCLSSNQPKKGLLLVRKVGPNSCGKKVFSTNTNQKRYLAFTSGQQGTLAILVIVKAHSWRLPIALKFLSKADKRTVHALGQESTPSLQRGKLLPIPKAS